MGGAVVSTCGVLVRRGGAREVNRKMPLLSGLEAPIRIWAKYPEAFPPVVKEDYAQKHLARSAPALRYAAPPPYYYGGHPNAYGAGYLGPRLLFQSAPRCFGRGYDRRWESGRSQPTLLLRAPDTRSVPRAAWG